MAVDDPRWSSRRWFFGVKVAIEKVPRVGLNEDNEAIEHLLDTGKIRIPLKLERACLPLSKQRSVSAQAPQLLSERRARLAAAQGSVF